jgi:hypothetical protein
VTAPGTYSISVSGPATASSPSFAIGTATNVYANALANSQSFYTATNATERTSSPLPSERSRDT